MGLGPLNAIYQARLNHYSHDRGIRDTSDQHVVAFGRRRDGSREPWPTSRVEGLNINLTRDHNCNPATRRLGALSKSGKIIQELESPFLRGAGWNVIKVVWGREWDALLHRRPRRCAEFNRIQHPMAITDL